MCAGPLYENFSKNIQENTVGYDFRGMSDADLRQAQSVTADQLKYTSPEMQAQRSSELQKEIDRRDAPRRLAEERTALIAQQQAESVKYQQQMVEQQAQQAQQTQQLQAQQAERIGGIHARGQAVAQSLQILGQRSSQAPTAAMSRPRARQATARSTSASLRMGSTSTGVGSGANISV